MKHLIWLTMLASSVFATPSSTTEIPKKFQVKVVTFNVLGIPTKGYESWEKRKEYVVEAVVADNPDIIGTQEMRYRNVPDYLVKQLAPLGYAAYPETTLGLPSHANGHDDVLKGQPLEGRHWQCWLFYKALRFEKLDGGLLPLREAPEVSFTGQRSINWIVLRDRVTGVEFAVLNTHWQPGPKRQKQREIEAAHMREFIESFPKQLPIIAMGDFNARPGTPEIEMLVGDGYMKDTISRKTNIDHIMQRHLSVVPGSKKYEHKKHGEIKVSDHPVLTVTLQLESK